MTDKNQELPALWQAIVDHTNSPTMFWIGEILLAELEKETGYKGPERPMSKDGGAP